MMITRGAKLIRLDNNDVAIQVAAIRRGPVPYAEIEPRGGGRRRAILLQELERDYRLEPGLARDM
ncbi:hypothetical protein AB0H00_30965 [Nocardia sp. NPDC023852]|uniref:hypothetical protein n=1 Tax=unclassified Nocardia TaxID=2637762 RepID=UPI002E12AFE6|nr:hypothetical protein OHB12_00535 [Nocardia sp. NBC_01730]WSY61638.1 hypothetical protein OH799_01485 [Nocardia sp. NBC_00881]